MDQNSLNTSLNEACDNHQYSKIKRLIKKGADPNMILSDCNRSVLDFITEWGKTSTLKYLLKAGADIKTLRYNFEGDTPFLTACRWDEKNNAAVLLKAGSSINETAEKTKQTGLMYAAQKGYYMAEFLVKQGIDINAKDAKGMTALMYAAKSGYLWMIKLFCENGAHVNEEDSEGYTPLSRATVYYRSANPDEKRVPVLRLKLIEELIKFGADINYVNRFGQTVLSLIAQQGFTEMWDTAIQYGARVDAMKENPVITAINSEYDIELEKTIKFLISKGFPWKSYTFGVKINIKCPECGKTIPLNGPFEQLTCGHCSNVTVFDEEFKESIYEDLGEYYGIGDEIFIDYKNPEPLCSKCNEKLDLTALEAGTAKDIICKKCGHPESVSPAPDWLKKFKRYLLTPTWIIGAEKENSMPENPVPNKNPVILQCISCSGNIRFTTDTPRNYECEHCGTVQFLPDPVWNAMHPVKKREVWYIYYAE